MFHGGRMEIFHVWLVDESTPDSDSGFSAEIRDKQNVFVNISCKWSQCE